MKPINHFRRQINPPWSTDVVVVGPFLLFITGNALVDGRGWSWESVVRNKSLRCDSSRGEEFRDGLNNKN